MLRIICRQQVAVNSQTVLIDIVLKVIVRRKNFIITAVVDLLCQHPFDAHIVTKAIAFVQTLICIAKRGLFQMNRLLLAHRLRYMDCQNHFSLKGDLLHIIFRLQHVYADALAIVELIKQIGFYFFSIDDANRRECSSLFFYTQDYPTASPISHGGIGGPKILRQLAFAVFSPCQLELYLFGFDKGLQIYNVVYLQSHREFPG